MITKITPEQEAKIPEYLNRFLLVGRRTKPVSFEEIKQSVRYLYENILQMKTPKIILVDSPYQLENQLGNQLGNQLRNQLGIQLRKQLEKQLWKQQFGISNLYYCEYYYLSFIFNEVLESELTPKLNNFVDAISKIHGASFTEDLAMVSQFPINLCLNEEDKLHNENGKALEYEDGTGLYAMNGGVASSPLELELR